jgi:hypothetical protein
VTLRPAERGALLAVVETQRLGCELAGSPLYAEVLQAVAHDLDRNGPCAAVLAGVADAPFGDAVLLRYLAGLHRLALAGEAPELAAHLPSAGGHPGRGLAAAVVAATEAHAPTLVAALGEGVQTNEVGRSASLLGGFLEVARAGLPLRVLEVGASAGLNLLFDRYRYEAGEDAFGPADSPLRFVEPWVSRAPDLATPVDVAARRGCDAAPIDPSSPEGRLRLRSFVWPDQLDRLARLDAALSVVDRVGAPVVDRAGAAAWASAQLADPAPGVATVLTHSIVLQYLDPLERATLVAAIESAGARADDRAPLAWLRLEPGGDQAELRLTTWPGGHTRVLATSAYHGPPVLWRG